MSEGWTLSGLLSALHEQLQNDLETIRKTLGHPTDKGDATEMVWIELFNKYLPKRYHATRAHIVDSDGRFSEQMDVVIHDRQYTPIVFHIKESVVLPAESVYAVFEAKQVINATHVQYASRKVATVRALRRTSAPVPTIDGAKNTQVPKPIIGGILALTSAWNPPLGDALSQQLGACSNQGCLDMGCIADAGYFVSNDGKSHKLMPCDKSATRFLFELMARLQALGTVPAIELGAYAAHIP